MREAIPKTKLPQKSMDPRSAYHLIHDELQTQGNPTLNLGGGNSCGELIAASIAFNGNATLDDTGTGCGATQLQTTQYVQLVP